ncbi:MAG: hypothetical protein HKN42_12100 [Granulosicoccus sp.]|nr:hypothetical protein [Granulosicoccus sp.]
MSIRVSRKSGTIPMSDNCVRTAISLMVNIVETTCEHEADLDLMRLANFMDLYRIYLTHAVTPQPGADALAMTVTEPSASVLEPTLGITDCASFEQFISDSRLLHLAAAAASRESGTVVATPPPLKISANGELS